MPPGTLTSVKGATKAGFLLRFLQGKLPPALAGASVTKACPEVSTVVSVTEAAAAFPSRDALGEYCIVIKVNVAAASAAVLASKPATT
jgi:hypothetical protein